MRFFRTRPQWYFSLYWNCVISRWTDTDAEAYADVDADAYAEAYADVDADTYADVDADAEQMSRWTYK